MILMYEVPSIFASPVTVIDMPAASASQLSVPPDSSDKPLNVKNTTNRVAVIKRARVKLDAAGVYCRRAPVTQAASIIFKWMEANRD